MNHDLTNYFPFGPEEGFKEKGYTIKAWQPATDAVKHVIILQAIKDDEVVEERESPMAYPNVFGVDVGDVMTLEHVTDEFIKDLPDE